MSNLRKRRAKLQEQKSKKQKPSEVKKKSSKQANCCLKCFYASLLVIGLVGLLALYGYVKAPFTARTIQEFSVKTDLVGVLAPNNKLAKSVKILELPGPEAIEEDGKNNLYVGLNDGRIVRIAPSANGVIGEGTKTNLTTGLASDFQKSSKSVQYGRPLGLRLQKDKLFVADARLGIYSVDINTQRVDHLLGVNDVNPPLSFTDDLYVTKNGKTIYFSDASAKYNYDNLAYTFFEGICDGRILQFNIDTKDIRTVVSDLCFGNGVQFSADEKTMLVPETLRYRVRVIDTVTWNTIKTTNVPIMPDNIRPTGFGTYWVAGTTLLSTVVEFLERNSIVRQILAGLLSIQKLMTGPKTTYNVILEMTEDGEILQSLHDPQGEATFALTHAHALSDGRIALGSYIASYLAIYNEKDVAIGLQSSS